LKWEEDDFKREKVLKASRTRPASFKLKKKTHEKIEGRNPTEKGDRAR